MLRPRSEVFFRLPGDSERRELHPGVVLTVNDRSCTASLSSPALAVAPKQELVLYYFLQNKFNQQPIRVDAILESRPAKVIGFSTVGEPTVADGRQCFRVTAVVAGLTATVGPEDDSPLIDVSATGFSVVCSSSFHVGQSVPVSIRHDGRTFTGVAAVQSVRQIEPGRTRYGMFCVNGRSASGDLAKGLAQMSSALQRAQLRRLAGA
jgi:hypothetical protein